MQSPPSYSPQPERRSKTGLIIGIVIAVLGLCCILPVALLGGGGLLALNKGKGMVTCLVAFEDLSQAVHAYADAHGGKLPNAKTWQIDVLPFYKSQISSKTQKELGPFKVMPAEGAWGCDNPDGVRTGIAFNSDLSGKKISDIKDPNKTILLFEVEKPDINEARPYKVRPANQGPSFMMGEKRSWIEVSVNGEEAMKGKPGKNVRINF